jgi:LuxR family quorum sensing-dependent transcriptional regulator
MVRSEFRHFDNVSASIEQFGQATTVASLASHISAAAAAYGYDKFLFAAAPNIVRKDFTDLVLLREWPADWFKEYVAEGYHAHDPIAANARGQCKAFRWKDVPFKASDQKTNHLMQTAAHGYGMREGLCIPIHGMHGYEAAISFSGADVDETPSAFMAMELMAMYAMSQLVRLRQNKTEPPTVLSLREREVLTWAAIGKTAWDTGCILSISTDTVNKHMASAMRKLKAYTKTQAVAESIRRGEISL